MYVCVCGVYRYREQSEGTRDSIFARVTVHPYMYKCTRVIGQDYGIPMMCAAVTACAYFQFIQKRQTGIRKTPLIINWNDPVLILVLLPRSDTIVI